MAGLVVVDTDLLIDFLRGKGAGARLVRALLLEHRLRMTSVTGFELRLGAEFLERRDDILRLFRSRTLPVDLASALHAGEIFATLQASGRGIGFADCLNAGVCVRHGLPLATRNQTHFGRVEGLTLVNLDSV